MSLPDDQYEARAATPFDAQVVPRAKGALRQVLSALGAGLTGDAGPQELPGIFERELQRALSVRAVRLREIPTVRAFRLDPGNPGVTIVSL